MFPHQEPTHFGLYALGEAKPTKTAPVILFVPGHGGSWKQGINLCAYLAKEDPVHFYTLDFHASASALHWSVLSAQAAFTKAAIQRLGQLHTGPKLVLGHSMGGLESHPLLLDPRFAIEASNLSCSIVSVSGGATDPLVPMKTTRNAHFIPLPAARDVYSSFSHVNLLFSRHSLHFLSRILRTGPSEGPWSNLLGRPTAATRVSAPAQERIGDSTRQNWENASFVEPGAAVPFDRRLEPQAIQRHPERTSRGETFDATDVLNCSETAVSWQDQEAGWYQVPVIEMQFPAKVCLYQLRETALVALLRPKRKKRLRRTAWAHWHADPLQDQAALPCGSRSAMGALGSWLQMLFQPLHCELPAGRALVTRMVLPLPQLPMLPVDLRIVKVSPSEATFGWQPPLVLTMAHPEVRVAALRLEVDQSEPPSQWASESRDAREVFAPRSTELSEDFSIFVIGHPSLTVTIEVQSNAYSMLAEWMRTQRFHAWLGACSCLSAADLVGARWAQWTFLAAWLITTLLLEPIFEGPSEMLPSLRVFNSFLAVGLALLSRRCAKVVSRCCVLLLAIASAYNADPKAPGLASVLLGPYLLCHLPSIILAVWLLLGQQREASAPHLQRSFDKAFQSSQHVASLWADSWILEGRADLHPGFRPALGLLCPAAALSCCMAGRGAVSSVGFAALMLMISVAVTIYAATSSSRLWWACQPVLAAHLVPLILPRTQAKDE
eukprot:g17754.t1